MSKTTLKIRLSTIKLSTKLLLLTLLMSFNVLSNSLRHEFDDGVMYSKLIKGVGHWALVKENNDYRYEVYDQAGHLKFKHRLPWQPTHQSVANNSGINLVGHLKRNGHQGTDELLVFDDTGLVKAFKGVIDFELISDTGAFYLIKDKDKLHELVVFDDKLQSINAKMFSPNFDDHLYLSLSPNGARLSLSSPGRDISSSATEKVYSGENYEQFLEWNFGGLPIFVVNQLAGGVSTFHVNDKLLAFKGHKKLWEFPPLGRRFMVDEVRTPQSGKYIGLKDLQRREFVVFTHDGKLVFDSKDFNGLEYLKDKKSGFHFSFKGDDLIIHSDKNNLYDIIDLETGERVKKLWLGDEKVFDIDKGHRLVLTNGKIKQIKH